MPQTQKPLSDRDANQTLQASYNGVNDTLSVDGFITGLVGRRVDFVIGTTNVPNDSMTMNFSELGIALYSIKMVFTTGTRDVPLFVERIS